MKAGHKYKRDLDNVIAYQEYDDHGAWRKKPPKAAPPQPAKRKKIRHHNEFMGWMEVQNDDMGEVTMTETDRRVTCAGCKNVEIHDIPMNGKLAVCGLSGFVVPQNTKALDDEKWQITFWRIPETCPLPDSEVKKSASKAPLKRWVTEEMPR